MALATPRALLTRFPLSNRAWIGTEADASMRKLARKVMERIPGKHFRVAIVGRPNVGKSTLFNKLVRRNEAITSSVAGTTRDRRESKARLGDLEFTVIDTGGLEEGDAENTLMGQMRLQVQRAVEDADVVLFMVDGREGITPDDQHYVRWVRSVALPHTQFYLLANKAETLLRSPTWVEGWHEDWTPVEADARRLGLGDAVPVSAEHGDGALSMLMAPPRLTRVAGLNALYEVLQSHAALGFEEQESIVRRALAESESGDLGLVDAMEVAVREWEAGARHAERGQREEHEPFYLAVLGRPNVGKSTLINRLLRQDRMVTGPMPGVTRDAIAVDWQFRGRPVRLVDTAGVRRAKTRDGTPAVLERLSVQSTLQAMRYSHVTLLVTEASSALTKQDLALASQVHDEGRGVVIAINKCDAEADMPEVERRVSRQLTESLPMLGSVPCLTISALTGRGTGGILPASMRVFDRWRHRVPTSELNQWVRDLTTLNPPPLSPERKTVRIKYMTQARTRPPTFVAFANRAGLPDHYVRFIANRLRDEFQFHGSPLRVNVRVSENPYSERKGGRRPTKS